MFTCKSVCFCGEEFNYLQNPFKRNVFTTYSQFLLITFFSKIPQAANATIQNHLDQTELKRCQFLNVPQYDMQGNSWTICNNCHMKDVSDSNKHDFYQKWIRQ